ncbi:MAG: 3-deoxy-8-phosphooctulonate synthase [bacterium]
MSKKLTVICGPCVIENEKRTMEIAKRLKDILAGFNVEWVFKASFDKANRLSKDSFRGPGLKQGLKILEKIKSTFCCKLITDVHETAQVREVSNVVDILQIPAFLCRQTDLIVAAASTKKTVNIKKGQFLAPWDMEHIVEKARSVGSKSIWVTERGSSFGYNRLIVDMVSLEYMKRFNCKVIFDVTHSLQLPGGMGNSSGGQREFAFALSRAATGVGVDGFFIEVHPEPDKALSDAATTLNLKEFKTLLQQVVKLDRLRTGGIK